MLMWHKTVASAWQPRPLCHSLCLCLFLSFSFVFILFADRSIYSSFTFIIDGLQQLAKAVKALQILKLNDANNGSINCTWTLTTMLKHFWATSLLWLYSLLKIARLRLWLSLEDWYVPDFLWRVENSFVYHNHIPPSSPLWVVVAVVVIVVGGQALNAVFYYRE